MKCNNFELNEDFKIYWNKYPIAKLCPGKDYLNPEIELIIDDMIEFTEQKDLKAVSYTHLTLPTKRIV